MKKALIITISIIAILFVGGFIAYSQIEKRLELLTQTEIEDVDLENVPDGIYLGEYNSFPVSASVSVTVSNHEITEIVITRHDNGQGQAAEAIIDDVTSEQTLLVDAIAGATYSSKVILLAIHDALSGGGSSE